MPQGSGAGIHWQVAQATSLQNIRFEMVKGGGDDNQQKGLFIDSGSGGFMSDLVFNGGNYGAFLGSQQFTSRNMSFNECNTAIYMNWNWAWTLKSVEINNCRVGLNMSNSPQNQTVGSVVLLDASLKNTPTGVVTAYSHDSIPAGGGVLVLENVDFSGSHAAVSHISGKTLLAGGSVVSHWMQGQQYSPSNAGQDKTAMEGKASRERRGFHHGRGHHFRHIESSSTVPSSSSVRPSSTPSSTCASRPIGNSRIQDKLEGESKKPKQLLDSTGKKMFERSRPQYEEYPASAFISVKSTGAKGDGTSDDTEAIQKTLDNAQDGQIVYFDQGAYIITSTIKVPRNVKITGEVWPALMASGPKFSDQFHPIPMLQIGEKGDKGSVELSDLVLATKGPAPGAVLIEWNIAETSKGSTGIWDVHFRVGGTAGSELQSDQCKKDPKNKIPNPKCIGAFMLLHITETANVYIENTWAWTADHELDLPDHSQVSIYTGRGILIENTNGPIWLYGTAAEHNQLYNYQIVNARNIFMGLIQTETPYYQPNPNAFSPFVPGALLDLHDPDFRSCTTDSCRKSFGLRILGGSSDLYVYGAGLYSFFDNYSQTCLDGDSCQENMVEVDECSDVSLYGLSTKASDHMVTLAGSGGSGGKGLVSKNGNKSNFCSTVGLVRLQGRV